MTHGMIKSGAGVASIRAEKRAVPMVNVAGRLRGSVSLTVTDMVSQTTMSRPASSTAGVIYTNSARNRGTASSALISSPSIVGLSRRS
jgi:hypothetical protein